ncbi:MgtC/SapB family protein [Streptococcus sp. Marseille-Q5986]|uniref:MgtC/SapB family protein n=1 Tax=Streptococcus sp. Marseille-Q5986 TaxID=2972782 RepID=UPI002264D9F9|nr:MgtC/SapB family protein [Streptococcus sp. Marseille-Q5986]
MNLVHELSVWEILLRCFLAILFGGIVGYERGVKNQAAGIRTYLLVCLGACVVMMTNQFIISRYGSSDPSRMGAQVISGLGFLGAGTIMVTNHSKVKGLTTAAGLWSSAAIGLAIGIGFYEGAILAGLILIAVLTLFTPLKDYLNSKTKIADYYLVFSSLEGYNRLLIFLNTSGIKILEIQNGIGNLDEERQLNKIKSTKVSCYLSLKLNESFEHIKMLEEMHNIAGVIYVEEIR